MINLFINPYQNPLRDHEFKECLRRNEQNEHIGRIILIRKNSWATFQDFFIATRDYPKDVNILANLDIYFDDSIRLAEKIQSNECYALTRWEDVNGNVLNFNQKHPEVPACWSQDAWIFRGNVNLTGFEEVTAVNKSNRSAQKIKFTMGVPGCDNKFAVMLRVAGYTVTNPSHSIRAIHLHSSPERTYGEFQILSGIKTYPFGYVNQTSL